MADAQIYMKHSKSSNTKMVKSDSVEVPDRELEGFRDKYGDNKLHLQNIRDLEVDNLSFIGFGTFSAVKKGFSNKYKREVAVKIVNLRDKRNKLYVAKYLHTEIKLWKELSRDNHENVLTLKEHTITNSFSYVVTELLTSGDLEKLILRRSLDEAGGKCLAKDVVSGVTHCHSNGIAHRDIKPANILVTENLRLKLADFTFATQKNPTCGDICGTRTMLAPEQCSRKPYNPFVSDIWQLGITIYMILFKHTPYKNQRRKLIVKEIQELTHHHKGVPLPYDVSSECKDLLARMLYLDPLSRYTAEQVKESSWFLSS